ncbi:ABC transporter ATP-binding protein [Sporolactobacillus terrae]|uniref:ABC transporter n=1 Tax=Sporolactobacillus terrae TaxID=269673 RepID=A0ABX5Q783_9BACL|nr:ABC transporter ATP-binding protein [Sporolactobacillus terrae]QAA22507.1 ABC transporter [Sporolactobacillus terrae]QAA25481.1 ABC transporter [Sporolactobacillus terrae]UAK17293.1 ABC transporter ATP-binding protein/permease [Sporolactobacillus terrae]
MGYLRVYWTNYRIRFLLALFFLSGEALADLLQPALMSRIVDQGVALRNMNVIERLGFLMLAITAMGAICASFRNLLSGIISQRFAQDLRQDLYIKIQSLSQQQVDQIGNASLITRLTNDVTRIQTFVNGLMRIMVKAPLVGIGSLMMAIHLNARLSLVLLGIAPIIAAIIFLNMKITYPYFHKVQTALDSVNRAMQNFLAGVRVIKVFNRSDFEQRHFRKYNKDFSDKAAAATKISSLFGPLVNLTVNAGIIAILWFGAIGVHQGSMEVGSIIAFTNYMTQLLFAIMMVNHAFTMMVRARASSERIGEVMNLPPAKRFTAQSKPTDAPPCQGTLLFDHVTFAYQEGLPVLHDLTFRVNRGETLGIIGPVASGKTTLTRLILRLYDPVKGTIRFNGQDLTTFGEDDLRKKIAIVPQHSLLFSGSVSDNIRWGSEGASDKAVREAAEIADADAFIRKLPGGYHARVGQAGVNLSGGQKQRIAIARALIRNPDLLILDDATSAVDARTDKTIRSRLKNGQNQMTCLLISQKASTLKDADQIIVLNQGRIEAVGDHQRLMACSSFYHSVCEQQLEEKEATEE